MALSYVEIVGINHASTHQVHCVGDPFVYSNISWIVGSPISKSTLDAEIAAYNPVTQANIGGLIFSFSKSSLSNLSWLSTLLAGDTLSGHIMPFNGTVVGVTGHCANTNGNTGNVKLFINGTNAGTILTFSGSGEKMVTLTTLNINFNANDKLRLQVQGLGILQTLSNVIVDVYVRWRG